MYVWVGKQEESVKSRYFGRRDIMEATMVEETVQKILFQAVPRFCYFIISSLVFFCDQLNMLGAERVRVNGICSLKRKMIGQS